MLCISVVVEECVIAEDGVYDDWSRSALPLATLVNYVVAVANAQGNPLLHAEPLAHARVDANFSPTFVLIGWLPGRNDAGLLVHVVLGHGISGVEFGKHIVHDLIDLLPGVTGLDSMRDCLYCPICLLFC